MDKLLTNSKIGRQDILNNPFAIEDISKATGFKGIVFENEIKFTLSQIAQIFETDERIIKRYLEKYPEKLKENGYFVLRGKRLKEFKLTENELDVRDINVPDTKPSLRLLI